MTKDEALRLALEALENSRIFVVTREKIKHPEGVNWYDKAITAIKAALEAKDEPAQQRINKLSPNDSFERDEAAQNIVREFMRNH